jgi:hypothetical protein
VSGREASSILWRWTRKIATFAAVASHFHAARRLRGGCGRAPLRYARPAVTDPQLSFFQRLSVASNAFLRALGDAGFAAQLRTLGRDDPALQAPAPRPPPERDLRPALQVLGALQRDGRLVDFIQQDIATFEDAEVGAAARVVHDGCRRALRAMLQLTPIMNEAEGQGVAVQGGYDPHAIRLIGNVSGAPPFRGKLQHQGWRARDLTLPEVIGDHDCSVIAPAEIEL